MAEELPIKYVKDKNGRFTPITSPKAVIDENGKNIDDVFAKKDLSNVTYPSISIGNTTTGAGDRVIQTYISSDGKTWYRKWASGWKECGGYSTTNADTTKAITLPLEFSNSNYIVSISTIATSGDQYLNGISIANRTTTQITIFNYDYGHSILYYCCGY